jgi:hypothetical protein
MATKKEKYCPTCGAGIPVVLEQGIGPYGSPKRTCPACGKNYYDVSYQEIAVNGIFMPDKGPVTPKTFKICIIPLLLGITVIISLFIGAMDVTPTAILFVIAFILFPAVIFIREWRGQKARLAYLREETERSEERMKDPEYVRTLVKLGYKVPKKYLPEKE